MMVKRFRKEWKPGSSERARSLGLSPRQLLLSIAVETERNLTRTDRALLL